MKNTKNNHIKHWDTRGRTGTVLKSGYKLRQVHMKRNYEHRMIMEEYLGRPLEKCEHIHHINGDKLDNRIENLRVVSQSEHQRFHALQNGLGKDRKGVSPTNKTPEPVINQIKIMRKEGKLLREICEELKLSFPTVQKYAKETRR